MRFAHSLVATSMSKKRVLLNCGNKAEDERALKVLEWMELLEWGQISVRLASTRKC